MTKVRIGVRLAACALAGISLANITTGALAETPKAIPAGSSAKIEQLKAINETLIQAIARGDVQAAGAIYGDNFVRISVDGEVLTRDAALKSIKPAAANIKTSYDSLDIVARDYGNTVVLTYHSIRHREIDGVKQPDFHYRVADVFVKQSGRWRKALSSGTPIPALNKPAG